MIYIDPRAGSGPLIAILGNMGAPVRSLMLEFGDACFDMEGPDGIPIPWGAEVKKVGDAIQCITTKRFCGHQLPGVYRTYKVRNLIIEGPMMKGPDGLLYVPPYKDARPENWHAHPGRIRYVDFMEWLTGIEVRAGFKLRFTRDTEDTAYHIFAAYVYGQKAWDTHNSFNVFTEPEELVSGISFRPIERRRRFAALLPNIGWKKSESAAAIFPSIAAMVNADAEAWTKVEYGKSRKMHIGIEAAKEIVKAIWGS